MGKDDLLKKYQEYAKEKGIELNSNLELVNGLLNGLLKNQEKYGEKYCPCRRVTGKIEEDKDKICPCKWSNEEIDQQGKCLCGLFVKPKSAID